MPFAPVISTGDIPGLDAVELGDAERNLRRKTHNTIRRVSEDLHPRVHLNTAVSALMELVNDLYGYCENMKLGPMASDPDRSMTEASSASLAVVQEGTEALVLLLSPFTPHLAEELWEAMGHDDGVELAGWPEYDESVARAEELVLPVQVNGKVRARMTVPIDTPDETLKEMALSQPQVRAHTEGKEIRRVVLVQRKLVSIVAK